MSKPSARILLVDDDPSLLRLLTLRLEAADYQVLTAASGKEALSVLRLKPVDLVITDLKMDDMDGMALFQAIQRSRPALPVIIITAHGSIPEAVTATQQGVFSFITKPIDKEELFAAIKRSLEQSAVTETQDWCANIITNSPTMEALLAQAKRAAQSDVSILIMGASGTGKELLARAIHNASPRRDRSFVAINCGALPEQLMESELFGHVKGAFTGAVSDSKGLFQAADGGTLFLDEIGDMPLPLQVKLLRAIQEKQVRPLGSTRSIPVDVRILSATHRDLQQAMAEGQFREDLYYRLNVVKFRLPPLAERPEDIPALVQHILNQQRDRLVKGYSPEAMNLLANAQWPGNIRQLVNVVEQTMALTTTPIIGTGLVQQALEHQAFTMSSLSEARAQFEQSYLIKVLTITGGNVTQAAKIAQRNRTDFYKLLTKHAIEPAEYKVHGNGRTADNHGKQ